MKITYVHQYFATMESCGGARSYNFARHLVRRGHEVTVITSNSRLSEKYKNKKEFVVDGIKVVNIKTKYTKDLNVKQRTYAFFKFMLVSVYIVLITRSDIVFGTSTPLTVAFPCMVAKVIKRVPFVFEVRDMWPDVPIELGLLKNRFLIIILKVFEKAAYRSADKIVCISDGIKDRIPVSDNKKAHIPIGCDLGLFNGGKNPAWKKMTGITAKTLIVFTGAIGVANCPEYLIEAAKILKRKNIVDITIALVGSGSAKGKVTDMIRENALDNVRIFDAVPKNTLPDILASADAGVILHGLSPTYQETAAPNKFYDYIAAGLPVIFNFRGPLRDLILERKAGYYVDPELPEQLSNAIVHVSRNKEEVSLIGKNARLLAEKEFDLKELAVKFEKVLFS